MIDSIRRAWNRVVAAFRRAPIDTDLDDEIACHLDAAIADNLRRGLAPEEARRQALVRFGGVARAMEEHREARGLPAMDVLRQDLRFTLRALLRDRSFAGIVILVVALGVGANVAVFSVVNTLLLRPLPFRDPGRLVWFATNGGKGGLSEQTYTVSAFEEFRRHDQSFQDVTNYQTFFNSIQYKLTGRGDPLPMVGVQVAGNFFPMLGIEPLLGRNFTPEECRTGSRAAVLLSHSFWQRQFARRPGHRRPDDHHQRRAGRHHRTGNGGRRSPCVFRFRHGVLSGDEGGFLRARLPGLLAHMGEHAGGSGPAQAGNFAGAGAGGIRPSLSATQGRSPRVVGRLQVQRSPSCRIG